MSRLSPIPLSEIAWEIWELSNQLSWWESQLSGSWFAKVPFIVLLIKQTISQAKAQFSPLRNSIQSRFFRPHQIHPFQHSSHCQKASRVEQSSRNVDWSCCLRTSQSGGWREPQIWCMWRGAHQQGNAGVFECKFVHGHTRVWNDVSKFSPSCSTSTFEAVDKRLTWHAANLPHSPLLYRLISINMELSEFLCLVPRSSWSISRKPVISRPTILLRERSWFEVLVFPADIVRQSDP